MIVILSPAQNMKVNPKQELMELPPSIPQYIGKADSLVSVLKKLDVDELCELLNISKNLAFVNYLRFQNWSNKPTIENSVFSVLAFTGEVYRGMNANDFSTDDLKYSQEVLRILSGLYGVLRPLDLIQAYRLEMLTGLKVGRVKNLYKFWINEITGSLNEAIENSPGEKVLINLASAEYSSAIHFKSLKYPVITTEFKEEKSGKLKMITVYAKRARGLMTRFIIKNRLEKSEDLKAFTDEGYYFENQLSKGNKWLFVR
jgi:cytoplasmic iron level regulating protein YaaA (DUF328/UPF0246 family)